MNDKSRKPNILLIAVDSLLATHMSAYGYKRLTTPHIDRFAAGATLFENTFSPHVPTTPAYASMLTGGDCFSTQVVALRHRGDLAPGLPTLPEILRHQGYRSLCVGFKGNPAARGFDEYLDYVAWGDKTVPGGLRKAENLNDVFLPKLQELAAGDQPFFAFLRHMDPHSPYLPPAPYDRLFYHGDPCDPTNRSMDPVMEFAPFADYFRSWMPDGIADKDYVIAQYDGALAYMDACIGRIFQVVESLGLDENTIIILNGDHGETLYDHQCWFDHHGLYDVCLRVPLILRYPGRVPAGRRVSGYNQHKDLVPTILELAGLPAPERPLDGRSLLRLLDGSEASFDSSFYLSECTWMRKHGWRTPEWKLMVALEPDFHFKPEVELYNHVTDPDENHNLAEQMPGMVAALRAEMEAWIARRERETGLSNPICNQPGWHGVPGIDYFSSSEEAYRLLHIGSSRQARVLQDKEKPPAKAP